MFDFYRNINGGCTITSYNRNAEPISSLGGTANTISISEASRYARENYNNKPFSKLLSNRTLYIKSKNSNIYKKYTGNTSFINGARIIWKGYYLYFNVDLFYKKIIYKKAKKIQ